MSLPEQVSQLINRLTDNEDYRQDLWVHYLSGNCPATLVLHLKKLQDQLSSDSMIQNLLWTVYSNPPSDKFQLLLDNFSNVEQSIICLLYLGLTVGEISKYKNISEIRIRHVISVVRDNDCWKELYGVKEKTNR